MGVEAERKAKEAEEAQRKHEQAVHAAMAAQVFGDESTNGNGQQTVPKPSKKKKRRGLPKPSVMKASTVGSSGAALEKVDYDPLAEPFAAVPTIAVDDPLSKVDEKKE